MGECVGQFAPSDDSRDYAIMVLMGFGIGVKGWWLGVSMEELGEGGVRCDFICDEKDLQLYPDASMCYRFTILFARSDDRIGYPSPKVVCQIQVTQQSPISSVNSDLIPFLRPESSSLSTRMHFSP